MVRDLSTINHITSDMSNRVQAALGNSLRKIILYGSYARGDYVAGSDIDVMVLADINSDDLEKAEKALWDIGWEIGADHDVMISVFLKDATHFYDWIDAMAYYRNIVEDGVTLYG
jgi:predicted nucleotidyltransferase